jgi:uncharacterized protein YjlB
LGGGGPGGQETKQQQGGITAEAGHGGCVTREGESVQREPETFTFDDDGRIPNSRLPLLVYRHALPADAAAIERNFAAHGWPGAWRNGVYPYHHFHSNGHEVLGVARGEAQVLFGGPAGRTLRVAAGDVVVIPAGVGHCNKGASEDFLVVGAYPAGTRVDECREDQGEIEELRRRAAAVPVPEQDPVTGRDGALARRWGRPEA